MQDVPQEVISGGKIDMAIEKIRLELEKGIKNKLQYRIERNSLDDNYLYGIPIKVSSEFLLFAHMYDFCFDGFKIIRLCDITSLRHDEQESFAEMIYQKEGITFDSIPDISIHNIKLILESTKNNNIIIECEKNDDAFFIGKVVVLFDTEFSFLEFDGIGVWQKDTALIKYKDVTCITISGRYLNTISKYTQNP